MNDEYLERFEPVKSYVRVGGKEIGVAYLKPKYEGEMLDLIFERGEERALHGLTPEEQIKLCRFFDGTLPNNLYRRRNLFPKEETRYEDVKEAFQSGYEVERPHGAAIWSVLMTRGGLFLGFLIDAEYMLYVGETIGITSIDTSGDNNGAGYKGGGEDSCSSLSLVMDPDIAAKAVPGVYMSSAADRTATVVTLPGGTVEVAPCAFRGCTALTEITLPEGVTKIGRRAFEGCTSLKRIILPSTLCELGVYAFCGCTALTEVTLPDGVTLLPLSVFEGCTSLREAILPGVGELSEKAFCGCSSLCTVSAPRLVHLGSFAFADCHSLAGIALPEGLLTIGGGCFRECLALTSLTIPSTVTKIGSNIFFYCDALTEVRLPTTLHNALQTSMKFSLSTDHRRKIRNGLRIVKL
ncbi:MAG: leucine-rich repeat domain-containing protein [Clostridia bacterium]|nr:leucine-rich repeat domain-containing protein [Clostridia bacterium]